MQTPNHLKDFREAAGFTQERVASLLSMERGTLSNYELGTREAPLSVLISLSNLYGIDMVDFYETDPEKLIKWWNIFIVLWIIIIFATTTLDYH